MVLNTVKAKHTLKDKGEAIKVCVSECIESENESELRPEFIETMKKRQLEPTVRVVDFKKHFGLNEMYSCELIIEREIEEIRRSPQHYKNLRKPLQHLQRVHIDKSL